MPGKLTNLNVVITRQEAAAFELQQLISAQSGTSITLPLFAIEEAVSKTTLQKIQNNLDNGFLAVCISQNAIATVAPKLCITSDMQWATIGPASAKYLQKYNVRNVIFPAKAPYEARTLIEELQSRSLNLQKLCIMLLTGEQGNEWLANELQRLGALVEVFSVYKRVMPQLSAIEFKTIINTLVGPTILVITCITSLVNLQTLGIAADINVYNLPLLVISERIHAYAKLQGFVTIFKAKSTSAVDILAALLAIGEINERTITIEF